MAAPFFVGADVPGQPLLPPIGTFTVHRPTPVGAAFMAARGATTRVAPTPLCVGPGATTVSLPRRRPTPQGGLSCSSGAIHLLPTSARIVSGWRIFHMNFFVSVFLSCLRRAPVMVPSSRQSRCGPDFPRLNNPPLETAKKGELRFPLLGTSPGLFYWQILGGGGLRCNAPAAPACM